MGKDLKGKELGEGLSQRKDGRYCARYTNYYGKRKTIYGKKLKEVKEQLRKELYENKLGAGDISPEDLTLDELFKMWRAWKEVEVKESSLSVYIRNYNKYIQPYFGVQKLRNIKSIDIQLWINEIHKTLKKTTLKITKSVINNMLEFAVEKKYLIINPCIGLKIKTEQIDLYNNGDKQKFLTQAQVNTFIDYAEKHHHKNILLYKFMLLTGVRVSEALALLWSDIDFDNKTVSITKTISQYYINNKSKIIHDQTPKTKTSIRLIPLCDDAIKVLKKQQQSKYTNDEYVFLSTQLNMMTELSVNASLRYLIDNMRKEINFPIITPHTFRHTFATRCLEKNISPKVVQKILGHSKLSMTMDLYTHVSDDYMNECIQKVNL